MCDGDTKKMMWSYLFSDARVDDEEGEKEGAKDDADKDEIWITSDRRPVRVAVEGGTAVRAERVKPTPHGTLTVFHLLLLTLKSEKGTV